MPRDFITEAVRVLDNGSVSRKELASLLGISLSGAGNVASELISLGIASEYDGKHDAQGKKCGMLYLRRDPIFAVIDVSSKSVSTHIFGYSLTVTDSFVFNIEDPLFLDDCLSTYFRMLSSKCPKLRLILIVSNGEPESGRFFGSGIPRLDYLPLYDMAKEHLNKVQVLLANRFNFISKAEYGTAIIVTDDGGILNTALIHNGMVLSRKDMTGRLSESEIVGNRSINLMAKYAAGFDEYTDTIAAFIFELICLVNANSIIYIGDRYSDCNAVTASVKEKLILYHRLAVPDIPHIVSMHHNDVAVSEYMLQNLRDEHIKSINKMT